MGQNNDTENKLIDGHNYDGIQEYDNPMPPWWVNLFWGTVIFSAGYCVYYMLGYGPSHIDEYRAELAAAGDTGSAATGTAEVNTAQLVKASLNAQEVELGKQIFAKNCVACHMAQGQGLIGPNLTDGTWIHGGQLDDIYRTISEGVLEKGMIAWKNQLSVEDRVRATAYIRSIQNTNVAGKAAEGTSADPTPLN